MKLLCIVGKKRSGKDTIADLISKNSMCYTYALADPIKETLCAAYSGMHNRSGQKLTLDHFYGKDENGDVYDRESHLLISNKDAGELILDALKHLRIKYNLKYKKEFVAPLSPEIQAETLCRENKTAWSVRRLMQTLGTDVVVNLFDEQFWNKLMMDVLVYNQNNDYFVITDIRQVAEIDLMRNLGATIIFVNRDINNDTNDSHITESGLEPQDGDLIIDNDGTIEDLENKLRQLKVI